MDFPVYRRYLNDRSYFKIESSSVFEELTITGRCFSLNKIETKTLPERNFLSDMLFNYKDHWIEISEKIYNQKKEYCLHNLTAFTR